MTEKPTIIFLGGYTKSGTTFLGRTLEAFEGVYSRGEMDFLRIFAGSISELLIDYNKNIQIVNEEVYDGQGKLKPVTFGLQRQILQTVFFNLFFNGDPIPDDCRVVIEKSPRNLFNIANAKHVLEHVRYVNIYRPVQPVFKSLIRHMADHRTADYRDPDSAPRQKTLKNFIVRWNRHVDLINRLGNQVVQVQYDAIVADLQGFLDFANQHILPNPLPQVTPVSDLTKEAYLQSLPPDRRDKSLVQMKTNFIKLSDEEMSLLDRECFIPDVVFDF